MKPFDPLNFEFKTQAGDFARMAVPNLGIMGRPDVSHGIKEGAAMIGEKIRATIIQNPAAFAHMIGDPCPFESAEDQRRGVERWLISTVVVSEGQLHDLRSAAAHWRGRFDQNTRLLNEACDKVEELKRRLKGVRRYMKKQKRRR